MKLHKCSSMSYLQCPLLLELYSITHAGPILPGIRVRAYVHIAASAAPLVSYHTARKQHTVYALAGCK